MNNNNNNNSNSNNNNNNNKAFSLIELSIVLIIIGLLVAGITGGQSLIESAKIRAIINEFRGYRYAVNTFYSLKERLPADTNNDGRFGEYSGDNYTGYFPYPYNGQKYQIGDQYTAPLIDLYLSKIIDFEVKNTHIYSRSNQASLSGALPKSNTIKDAYYYFISKENNNPTAMIKNINYNMIILNGYATSKNAKGKNSLTKMSFVRKIDNKIDDDEVLGGKFRATCLGDDGRSVHQSYVDSANKYTCHQFGLLLDF